MFQELLKSKNYEELKEKSEGILIEKRFIHTKIFGWIRIEEADWLNKKLKLYGFDKTCEELYGVPSYQEVVEEIRNKKSIKTLQSRVYDFVYQFFEMQKAREANLDRLVQQFEHK